jgi:hypothetical protein
MKGWVKNNLNEISGGKRLVPRQRAQGQRDWDVRLRDPDCLVGVLEWTRELDKDASLKLPGWRKSEFWCSGYPKGRHSFVLWPH